MFFEIYKKNVKLELLNHSNQFLQLNGKFAEFLRTHLSDFTEDEAEDEGRKRTNINHFTHSSHFSSISLFFSPSVYSFFFLSIHLLLCFHSITHPPTNHHSFSSSTHQPSQLLFIHPPTITPLHPPTNHHTSSSIHQPSHLFIHPPTITPSLHSPTNHHTFSSFTHQPSYVILAHPPITHQRYKSCRRKCWKRHPLIPSARMTTLLQPTPQTPPTIPSLSPCPPHTLPRL